MDEEEHKRKMEDLRKYEEIKKGFGNAIYTTSVIINDDVVFITGWDKGYEEHITYRPDGTVEAKVYKRNMDDDDSEAKIEYMLLCDNGETEGSALYMRIKDPVEEHARKHEEENRLDDMIPDDIKNINPLEIDTRMIEGPDADMLIKEIEDAGTDEELAEVPRAISRKDACPHRGRRQGTSGVRSRCRDAAVGHALHCGEILPKGAGAFAPLDVKVVALTVRPFTDADLPCGDVGVQPPERSVPLGHVRGLGERLRRLRRSLVL